MTRFAHVFLFAIFASLLASAVEVNSPTENYDRDGAVWDWGSSSDEGGGGSSYLGVDIDDVSAERLGALKLKEEHGVEITMVDQDAPAGKAGLHEHDVIVSMNGTEVESYAQLRRMIKETPPGRVISLGISRDGQPLTIKVQLADRRKSMAWEPKPPETPKMPKMPTMPDFDMPVSVVIVHSSARSGLMVENLSPQLGEFFGVKGGNGILVRSVEKGSRGDKAGFRAGDVIVKVNNQPVHDTSDFTHVIRSSQGGAAMVTVMREKREQNLNLTLPEKKDSGELQEETFDDLDFSAETQEAVNHVRNEIAHLAPAVTQQVRVEVEERVKEQGTRCREQQRKMQDAQKKLKDEQKQLLQEQQGMVRRYAGQLAEI
jgi:membrane-associated protease RseP (regulator of RpoE activity)